MTQLDGRPVIVTGAARGIGAAIARDLAAYGARVLLADRDLAGAEEVAADIRASGCTAHAAEVDVSSRAAVAAAVERATTEWGGLGAMINNAGVVSVKPFLAVTEVDWRRVMDVNALGTLFGMQEAARAMIAGGRGGKIVNMASITGKLGAPDTPHYSASKAAVISLTQSGARGLAEHGITVNAVCPGVVDTPMWRGIGEDMVREGWTRTPEEALPWMASGALLKRPSKASDIVGIVRFLVSTDSDFMTGQSVVVDGGIVFS